MVNFFSSNSNNNNVAIHLLHGDLGIIYSRVDNGLLKPKFHKMDEVDFIEFTKNKFDLGPVFTAQNKEQKYLNEGISFFKIKCYENAINSFEKIIAMEDSKVKARAFYLKGVCLLYLSRHEEGLFEIQKAINIDSNFQKKGTEFIRKFINNKGNL